MAEFRFMPLFTDAYLGDTTHLTTIEHGAYLLLLMVAWRTPECSLPDDDNLLSRYTKLGPKQWERIRPILEQFFIVRNGQWIQQRLQKERVAVKQRVNRNSLAGKASALKRKETRSTSVEFPFEPNSTNPYQYQYQEDKGKNPYLETDENTPEEIAPKKASKKPKDFYYLASIIRMTKSDFQNWQKEFKLTEESLQNLLDSRNQFLARLPESDERRARWWMSTRRWLKSEVAGLQKQSEGENLL